MTKYLLTAAVAALFATPAAAADFSGPRVEARLSYDRATLEATLSDGFTTESGSDKDSGIGLGAEAGYDAQVGGNFVVGGYVGGDWSSAAFTSDFDGTSSRLEAGRNLYLGVRAGAAVGPALLYAKGGLSRGRLKLVYDDGFDRVSDSTNRSGWHLGAGVEVGLGKAYVKGEYTHTEYNGSSFSDPDFGIDAKIDAKRDQLTAAVGFRF
ncbi:outer membrane protein [Sphingomonas astaxanthinifaciens]|uniref:Outer membrane protein beta-barrel domain-containing protein n=1 Tax=Sphingomonas astaxanthinifaciens DSM 22298 TaxID=1123267 RepID=A0ABQ5Z8Z0_9SPHN|nr:outer membrane beta-barrel protein [Sphingomonas astaxanthinifaciens]GLR48057.1 hypothetical protein GCM10007925_17700 [Sphingomonas astaxanthinifaciens DSM 22298]